MCASAGYPVRAVIMPIIPVSSWQNAYGNFLRELLQQIRLERITLGGVCSYPTALHLAERKLGKGTAISKNIRKGGGKCP